MTLIDKAEAHDDDLIRRGDALAAAADLYRWSIAAGEELEAAIAALPARGVGVKAGLTRREMEVLRAIVHDHYCSELETNSNPGAEMAKGILGKIKRTLAFAPTDAAHVNETPKSEHDGADVLTDAAQALEAAFRDGWGFAYRQWQATGSVPDPDYKPSTEART